MTDKCGHSSTVEHHASNVRAAGSSPAARSMLPSEVAEAIAKADDFCAGYKHGFETHNAWATIRAHLHRLAEENARLIRENDELRVNAQSSAEAEQAAWNRHAKAWAQLEE